ncbi:TolC family protein [Pseudomonas sp. nanlin1]|uniref:TolC family protein n=1 Tax=Pseudomonas sp. nanlin1 TaxID=3040605 RepID=UPI00388E9740
MVERVFCNDPQVRRGLAISKAQAEAVEVRKSAYLPRLDGIVAVTGSDKDIAYDQRYNLSTHGYLRQIHNRLSLSWVLFDFGHRDANLRNAKHLLIAANAGQDNHLQDVFLHASQLFYDTVAAHHRFVAASQVSAYASEYLQVATAKYESGAAALSDRLQAQTAYSQAQINRGHHQRTLLKAKGLIALRMGLPPETPLELAVNLRRNPGIKFSESVNELIEQAKRDHPSMIFANSVRDAQKAAIEVQRAETMPRINLKVSHSNVRTDQSVQPSGRSYIQDNSISIQLIIPLFDGFEGRSNARAAQARLEQREAEILGQELQVALDVWSNVQDLKSATDSLDATDKWVEFSSQSLNIERGRYQSGVGSMIELLNALSASSAANQEHIDTMKNWQIARLRLGSSLGKLGFWSI